MADEPVANTIDEMRNAGRELQQEMDKLKEEIFNQKSQASEEELQQKLLREQIEDLRLKRGLDRKADSGTTIEKVEFPLRNDYFSIPDATPVAGKKDPYGSDYFSDVGLPPNDDPLAPLFDPMLRMESDIPNAGILTKPTNPDLVTKPDTLYSTDEFTIAPPVNKLLGKDVPYRPNTPKERLTFLPDPGEGNWPIGAVPNDYSQKDKDFYKGTNVEDILNAPALKSVGKEIREQTHKAQLHDPVEITGKAKIDQKAWDTWLESMPGGKIEDRRGESKTQNYLKMVVELFKNAPDRAVYLLDSLGLAPLRDNQGLPQKLGIDKVIPPEDLKT